MPHAYQWPIYGHDQQISFLQSLLEQGNFANAYLFYGPKGLGKKMVAQFFAQSLFCENKEIRPCLNCQACKFTASESYPDFYTLGNNPEDLTAEGIKNFLSKLSLSAVMGGQKLAIIYNVNKLNLFAFNALLKVLEEPPQKTTIILLADQINELPATVISRCQLLKFKPLPKKQMLSWLENFNFTAEEKETIINLSFGKPGVALNLINDHLKQYREQCEFMISLIIQDDFVCLQSLDKWFVELKKNWPNYKIYELGDLTIASLNLLELILRDILWVMLGREPANLLYEKQIKNLAFQYSMPKILKNLLLLDKLRNKIKKNVSPQLIWENLILALKN